MLVFLDGGFLLVVRVKYCVGDLCIMHGVVCTTFEVLRTHRGVVFFALDDTLLTFDDDIATHGVLCINRGVNFFAVDGILLTCDDEFFSLGVVCVYHEVKFFARDDIILTFDNSSFNGGIFPITFRHFLFSSLQLIYLIKV